MQTKNSIITWSDKELNSRKKTLIAEMDKENSIFASYRDKVNSLQAGEDTIELELAKAEMLVSELRYQKLFREFNVLSNEFWRRIENSEEFEM